MDSTTPICGYCGLSQASHNPNDHIFDAVGGSILGPITLDELAVEHPLPGCPPWYSTFTAVDWALLAVIIVMLAVMGIAAVR